jgi:hypothetical protein
MDEISLKSGMTVCSALPFKDIRPFDRPLMSEADAHQKLECLKCLFTYLNIVYLFF